MALHKAMTLANNHTLHAWSYADASAREGATGLLPADVGKVSLQADDNSYWVLIDDSPVEWGQILGSQGGSSRLARVEVDATSGLSIGTHNLDLTLPDNSYVVRAWYDVVTTFTSATDAATIQLGVNTDDASGIVGAIAISNGANPWDAGAHEATPDDTVANFTTQTTGSRTIDAVVAVEALTNGKLNLFLEYVVSE